MSVLEGAAASATGFRPIVLRDRPDGPLTTWLLRRAVLTWGVIAAVGLAVALSGVPDVWRILGLGLVLPGGSLLAMGHEVLFALAAIGFAASLGAWIATGFAVVPAVVWLLTLLPVAVHDHRLSDPALWIVPLIATGGLGLVVGARQVAHRRGRRRARTRNAYLASDAVTAPSRSATETAAPELSPDDLGVARYVLDRCLQPVERFDGFDVIEQVQTSALRYQLNFASYALALMQTTRTPAFRGYVSEGQRLAIAKMQDRRVWEYWRLENLLGNLDRCPDPVRRDNIMFSGFLGVMLGMYARVSGDHVHDEPGALRFRWDERREYLYDHGSLAEAVARNFSSQRLGFFPCEPHWNFSICNTMGMTTLALADRVHGTEHEAAHRERWLRTLDEEFTAPDGRLVPIRNGLVGFRIPTLVLTFLDAATAYFAHGVAPEIAERSWAILRHEVIDVRDGLLELSGGPYDGLDDGNYTRSPAGGLAGVMLAATEMGDLEVAGAALRSMEERVPPRREDGELAHPCSVKHNLTMAMARFSAPGAFHDLVRSEEPTAATPLLADAPYPDVLVARAVSDGRDLRLVLRPGAGPGRRRLGLDGLRPGAGYAVRGATVGELIADEAGSAVLEVDLEGRLEVTVTPA